MKIAWLGNDPWTTSGYGKQARIVLPRLKAAGYDVAVFSNWGLQGGKVEWEGITCYPFFQKAHATDVLVPNANEFFGTPKDGLVVSFIDVWPADVRPFALTNWAPWLPIDHWPLSMPIQNRLKTGDASPIAMSKFGLDELKTHGFSADYIPCAVETDVYTPGSKAEARARLGIPQDAYVVAMVAVNKGTPSRKSFPEVFSAFKALHDKHPDAFLYLHTEKTGVAAGEGLFLKNVLDLCGIPETAYKFCDQFKWIQGAPEEDMVATYRAADVLAAPSMAEGFGVPIIEAQACGTPVIVTDSTSMPELCAVGQVVDGQRIYIPLGAWIKMPSIAEITRALLTEYELADKEERATRARNFALKYDADLLVKTGWIPTIEKIAEERQIGSRPGENVKWFKERYGFDLRHRYPTMLTALSALAEMPNPTIVETGTSRTESGVASDGNATVIFAEFTTRHGGKAYSVDIDPEAVATAKKMTQQTGTVEVTEGDSVDYLKKFPKPIDLLYLDSFDCMRTGIVDGVETTIHQEREAQEHQLKELEAAWDKLHDGSLVLLDDNGVGFGGKTDLAKKLLEARGAVCLKDSYQSLWRINGNIVQGQASVTFIGRSRVGSDA